MGWRGPLTSRAASESANPLPQVRLAPRLHLGDGQFVRSAPVAGAVATRVYPVGPRAIASQGAAGRAKADWRGLGLASKPDVPG